MRISKASVHRPVTTSMAFAIVVLLGGVSLSRLPIDLMPDITYPVVTIRTNYENVGPEEIELLITRPIEEVVASIQGVEEMTSISGEGRSRVRVSFTWGTDLDAAVNDIRAKLDRIRDDLPEEAEQPVVYKFDLSSFPVVYLGIAGQINPVELRRLTDEQVKYRVERVPGVAAADTRGGLRREIHVSLDKKKLMALDLSVSQVMQALQAENLNLPAGEVEEGNLEVLIRTQGEFADVKQIMGTVVLTRGKVPVYLRDFANVSDSYEEIDNIVRINGVPGVRLAVYKRSGSNTVRVAEGVMQEVERINQDMPQIEVSTIFDTSTYIKNSIRNLRNAALFGGCLAVVILLVFLRNIRSTAIVAAAIPVSIVATFALMYFCGFTLNIMTFGGLALGVGMLVDNAIVVLENIYRNMESRGDPLAAAVRGSDEVATAIVASTLTTLAVFLPLIFVRGMAGVMFRQLSFVVSFALFCSLTVALTLVPVLSSKYLKFTAMSYDGEETLSHMAYRISGAFFSAIEDHYCGILEWALSHRKTVMLAAALLFGASLCLVPFVGREFMPASDEGEVRVEAETAVGTQLEVLDRMMQQAERIVAKEVPEAENILASVGGGGWRVAGGHTAQIRISLVGEAKRSRSSEQISNDLRGKLAQIPGLAVRTRPGTGLFILRMGSGDADRVSVEVRGYDLDTAKHMALRVKEEVERVDGVTDARISRDEGRPEEVLHVDRAKAADLGLNVSQIAHAVETYLSGSTATFYREAGDEYRVLVRLKEIDRLRVEDVLDMTVTTPSGKAVVLKNVVQMSRRTGPVTIERKDQERVVTINANFTGRDLGSIVADVRDRLKQVPVPKDFTILFGGEYEEQQKAFRELLLGLGLAVALVYMVMASQFESYLDPFLVMFSMPLGIIGVLLMMVLTHTTLNVQSFIGAIMLGGIVVNNAIVLVDYTNLLRRRDKLPLREAVLEGGRRRLRPILMTTLTTCLALIPLAMGLGEGGEVQAPMARVVIGGLLSSGLITLVFIPTLYTIFHDKLRRQSRGSAKQGVNS